MLEEASLQSEASVQEEESEQQENSCDCSVSSHQLPKLRDLAAFVTSSSCTCTTQESRRVDSVTLYLSEPVIQINSTHKLQIHVPPLGMEFLNVIGSAGEDGLGQVDFR